MSVRGFFEAYAFVILLIAVCAFFSLFSTTSATFPTLANFQIVVGTSSVEAIVALGALIPLICKQWDLSVGASTGLSAVVCAKLLGDGSSVPVAATAGVAAAMTVGMVNAFCVTRLRTNGVITTLGTAAIVVGVIDQLTGGTTLISHIPSGFTGFGAGKTAGIPNTGFVLAAVAIGVWYLLSNTPFGRYVYAMGSNEEAAELVGINTRRITAATFLLASLLSGIAGGLAVARAGGADPGFGDSLTLPALAAAFLSAAAIKPGRYNWAGTLVALFLLATINSGLNLADVQPYVSQYVNGVALIAGVALAVNVGRRRAGT